MTTAELQILSKAMGPVVLELIAKAVSAVDRKWFEKVATLEDRILELETRPPVTGPVGPKGADGKDGLPGANGKDGRDGVDGKDGLSGLNGKDGRDGVDGKDGAPGERGAIGETGAPGAQGEKGIDGRDGFHGRDGKDGSPGMNGRDVEIEQVKAMIVTELASWPRPVDGRNGTDGKDGAPGLNGKDGADGLHGKDGRDGVDGVGIDDASVTFDDVEGYALVLAGGGKTKAFRLRIPFDAGVFEPGQSYPAGAGVTADGHYFMAKCDTVQAPGEGSTDWRLVVRRGKQGRDGKPGGPGPQGPPGTAGPQGPQGRKGDPVGV